MSAIEAVGFDGPAGRIQASVFRPAGVAPFPAILLLQEGIGVTTHLLDVAQRLAAQGYFVLVPDLYCRDPERQRLTEAEVLEWLPLLRAPQRAARVAALAPDAQTSAQRVIDWFTARDTSTYLPDAREAVAFLQRHGDVRADAIGAIGFSLGGGLTAQLAAAGERLAAGVIFYGSAPEASELTNVNSPLQGHYAQKDLPITANLRAFAGALKAAGKEFVSFVYEGTEHGFFNELRPTYDKGAAQLSFDRTLAFFRQHLSREAEPIARALG
jgi:carboxymethylenebutenolidase